MPELARWVRSSVAACGVLLLAACAGEGPVGPDRVEQLPGWTDERPGEALTAFLRSCARTQGRLDAVCAAARAVPADDDDAARLFFAREFRPAVSTRGLMTGYFEPELPGSRTPTDRFRYAVLRPPPERTRYSRAEVLDGALSGRGLEILYLQSLGDLYLVQLQGAGRVRLPDGSLVRLGHAGDNGRASVPVTRLFSGAGTENGEISYRTLRAWMLVRPREAEARIRRDASYVYFRERHGADPGLGTTGLSGAPLTPLRSVAVDPGWLPLGMPAWLDVETPAGRLRRLVVAQDAGEPVAGPGRADLYWGWGAQAEAHGGRMHAEGRIWPLLPR